MTPKVVVLAIAALSATCGVLTGEQTATPSVFTAAQSEAGRAAYEDSCGRCHTYRMLGRKGEEGELPALASLAAPYLKFIGTPVHVPALLGKNFVNKYRQKTVSEMFTLFRGAADTTPAVEFHMSDDTLVNITAYILDRNGAKPGNQALTKTSAATVDSIIE